MSVAIVTDSTAYLPADLKAQCGIVAVPLHVIIAGQEFSEGVDVSADEVAQALREFRPVSTSRPSPQALLTAYEQAAAAGAEGVVSIHISADMSSTIGSAQLAAQHSPVPVEVVDSQVMGMAMGYAAVSAAHRAAAGGSVEEVAEVARRRCRAATICFYVDSLEYLRRGGRIGAASKLFGSALAIKPILGLKDGSIHPLERVRTASKALARLEELAVAATADLPSGATGVDLAVHHLDSAERADALVAALRDRAPSDSEVRLVELGAVVGAHVGPGTLAVAVSPRFE